MDARIKELSDKIYNGLGGQMPSWTICTIGTFNRHVISVNVCGTVRERVCEIFTEDNMDKTLIEILETFIL